jgi:16S rRNA (adenine1518-N6/adenine1519-N6)-dimethyltransferase
MDTPKNSLPLPDPAHPSEVRAFLRGAEFHPSRVLGQNFLVDRNILEIILAAAGVGAGDEVIEVGPGLGVLTGALLERGARLAAIEKDHRLAAWLRERYGERENFTLHEGDALEADWGALCPGPGRVLVSNLPYAIAARLLVDVAALEHPPARMVVMVQREVADRMTAAPSTADYGLLGILLQRRYAVSAVKNVSASCFWPPPEVQSTVCRLDLRPGARGSSEEEAEFRRILRLAFSRRRKTLARSLRGEVSDPVAALSGAGLPASARPEELSPEQWGALVDKIAAMRVEQGE